MKLILKLIKYALLGFLSLVGLTVILGVATSSSKDHISANAATPPPITSAATPKPISAATPKPTATATPEPAITISASVLSDAYEANPIAADAEYRGKRASISGTVLRIDRELMGNPFIILNGDVQCVFTNEEDELTVAKLSKGQRVTVVGEIHGTILLNVLVDDCRFESIQAKVAKH